MNTKRILSLVLAVSIVILGNVVAFSREPRNVDKALSYVEQMNRQYSKNVTVTITKEDITDSELVEFKEAINALFVQDQKARLMDRQIELQIAQSPVPYGLDYTVYSGSKEIDETYEGQFLLTYKQSLSAQVSPDRRILKVYNIKTKGTGSTQFTSNGNARGYAFGDVLEYMNVSDRGHLYYKKGVFEVDDRDYYLGTEWHLSDITR